MRPAPLVVAATLVALAALPAPAVDPPPDVYEQMAVDLLRQYLQVDTTNPPGNELRAARFFKEVLDREGIPSEIDEFAPGRANLLATLKGSGPRRALILANHMDVVPADASRWTAPPFSGAVKAGLIYGRGAQDMKSEGILQLVTLIRAARERLPLERDVLFLATADEEVDFAGALRALSAAGWRERLGKAEYYITEGGENVIGEDGRPLYFGIDTAEKGPFWLRLSTSGTPGHGSRPLADSALNRLVRALERVRMHKTEMKVLPGVARFFRDQAASVDGRRAEWYRDLGKALLDPEAAQALYEDREASALLRNTISITVVKAGYKTNVIPGSAEAELDVRLLPGEDPQAFLAELRGVIDDPQVVIVPIGTFRAPNESPTDTELFRIIESTIARHYPGVPVTTKMLSGATESVLVRPFGIVAYGFTPLLATPEEVAATHGDDERVREDTVRRSAPILYEVVSQLCRRQN
jgi:acetylornithine deacetylase/succinyl-diaminopimelate desuccinylase-like protein